MRSPSDTLQISREEVASAVAALGLPRDSLAPGWRVRRLGGDANSSATGGLWRLQQDAAPGAISAFSMVLKIVRHSDVGHPYWRSDEQPTAPMYWRREPLVYQSGLSSSLGPGFRGPRLLHSVEAPEGIRLCLEDVQGVPGPGWSLEQYEFVARQLGRAQGAFVAGRPLPSDEWLSRGWLEAYLERRARDLDVPPPSEQWDLPLVRRWLPRSIGEAAAREWAGRAETLAAFRRLPPTLCHLDFWPTNLFLQDATAGGEPVVVAIDWAFAGIGTIGEDAGNLVPDAMFDMFVDARVAADELTERIIEGYARGLADAGAKIPEANLRFAVTTAASLKYVWLAYWLVRAAADEARHALTERTFGKPYEETFARRAAVARHVEKLAAESRRLRAALRN